MFYFFATALLFKLFEPLITPLSIQYANGADGRKRRNNYDKAFSHQAVMGNVELFNKVDGPRLSIHYDFKIPSNYFTHKPTKNIDFKNSYKVDIILNISIPSRGPSYGITLYAGLFCALFNLQQCAKF